MAPNSYSTEFIQASYPAPSVLLLTLSRKPVNAFHKVFWRQLADVFTTVSNDVEVNVVVLSSAFDKVWTAGIDVADLGALGDDGEDGRELDPARKFLRMRRVVTEFQKAISTIEECEKPVIAAINGACYGLGLDIIAACDIRYCTEDAKFSIKEVAMALAADIGSLQRLPPKTGNDSLLRELSLTGRDFDADEAVELGLVSKRGVVKGKGAEGRKEVIERAVKLGQQIAALSPIAVIGTKHLLNYSRDHSIEEGLNYTKTWNSAALQTEDLKEAVTAFLSKQKPKFAKL